MKDLTLRLLSQISGLAIQDLSNKIKESGKTVPDLDSPLSQELRDLLAGSGRKKSIGLNTSKPLSLSKKISEPDVKKETVENVSTTELENIAAQDSIAEETQPKTTDENTTTKKILKPAVNQTQATTAKHTETKTPYKPSISKNVKNSIDDEANAKRPALKNKIIRQISQPIKLNNVLEADADDLEIKAHRIRSHHAKPIRTTRAPARPAEIKLIQDLTVTELARKLQVTSQALQRSLRSNGFPYEPSSILDIDTAVLVANEMGVQVVVDQSTAEDLLSVHTKPEDIKPRAPVVTIMGHVDHGKTSLLDAFRKSSIVDKEAGGITQHIGAYQVESSHGLITFIDTPGHEAFTAIRSRGAQCTDIVILVVASDDGVMPQTREALQHAQAAGVKIIVALTKIDKAGQKTDEIKNQLAQYNIVPEEWGGNTQFIGVSSKTGEGLPTLLEAISLEAEVMELKARSTGPAKGIVLEAKLDRSLGPVATVLIQEGLLRVGDFVIMGTATGKVRRMNTANSSGCTTALPSVPVEIIGMNSMPAPGDVLNVVKNEKIARLIISERVLNIQKNTRDNTKSLSLDEMFSQIRNQEIHQLNIILKADAQGSMGAIAASLNKLTSDELNIKILSSGVGAITKTDVELASASKAIILGFNVRPDSGAKTLIEQRGTEVYYFSIIYELITRVKDAIKGIIGPKWNQEIIGSAGVREVFRSSKFGSVAGCLVQEGLIKRNAKVRVIRDHIVIFEGTIQSLRRFSQDTEEVRKNTECGIGIKDYTDIRVGDVIEAFILVECHDDDS